MWLLNPLSLIYMGLTPKTMYIGMCAKGQIILEFSLMWIWLTYLLNFHMPWDRSDSTLNYPIEELYKESFWCIKGMRNWEQRNYSPLFLKLILEFASLCPFGSFLCSSQDYLLLVSLLLRDGGLKWWKPKWGTQFLWFTDVLIEIVTLVISVFILIKISFLVQ